MICKMTYYVDKDEHIFNLKSGQISKLKNRGKESFFKLININMLI